MTLDDLVGIPWTEYGRDLRGCDCWGLVRLYYREFLGIELPSYDEPRITDDHPYLIAGRAGTLPWALVDAPEVGDLALFRRPRREWHVGVLVGRGIVLHNDSRSRGSAIQRVEHVGPPPEWWRYQK